MYKNFLATTVTPRMTNQMMSENVSRGFCFSVLHNQQHSSYSDFQFVPGPLFA